MKKIGELNDNILQKAFESAIHKRANYRAACDLNSLDLSIIPDLRGYMKNSILNLAKYNFLSQCAYDDIAKEYHIEVPFKIDTNYDILVED